AMERKGDKRERSEDDDNNNPQSKVWVNQKICDANDPQKMKQVHGKCSSTARAPGGGENPDGINPDGEKEPQPDMEELQAALHSQYQLLGDGSIQVRNMKPDVANPTLERKKSRCCHRDTLIHGICANCTMDLCEECGYSCSECMKFICRSCVTLFGHRLEEAGHPLCEACQMFYA
ncbi:hypothetical protein KR018_004696, partial [Drosophila ironensis]